MEKNLEEIFCEEGKFQNKDGEKVKPEFIGPAKYFSYIEQSEYTIKNFPEYMRNKRINFKLSQLKSENKEYNKVNAFLESNEKRQNCSWTETAINFLKI